MNWLVIRLFPYLYKSYSISTFADLLALNELFRRWSATQLARCFPSNQEVESSSHRGCVRMWMCCVCLIILFYFLKIPIHGCENIHIGIFKSLCCTSWLESVILEKDLALFFFFLLSYNVIILEKDLALLQFCEYP